MENNNEILLALIELAKVQPDLFRERENLIFQLCQAEIARYMKFNIPQNVLEGLK